MVRKMRPFTAFVPLVVLAVLISAGAPTASMPDGSGAADRGSDILILRIISKPIISSGDIGFDQVTIHTTGDGLIGLSSGEEHEIVIDPTPGSPELPWIATVVHLEGDILDVDLRFSRVDRVPCGSSIRTVPRATTPWEPEETWGIWGGEQAYPAEQVLIRSLGYTRIDGRLMHSFSLWFCPFMLDGESLSHGSEAQLEVTRSTEMAGPTPSRITGDPGSVPGTLSISEKLDVKPQYMIITAEDNAEALQALANWRNGMGIAASVITVEDIYEQYEGSEDPADLIRDYIKDVLDTWGTLEHVLLAGDWETVPVKRVLDSEAYGGWDDGYIPADTYFQCLDGTWDLDGDGLYSEPGDMEDIIPDLSVSRLAIDDPSIWKDKIDQIISYESGTEGTEWSSRALLIAANTHNYGDGSTHSEYLWNKYLNDTYADKVPLYEDDGTLTLSAVDEALGSGVSFVQFVDHGGPTVWCDDYGAGVVYRDRDARELTNSNMLPVISTLACLTNWFDDTSGCRNQRFSEGLGEVFTENVNGGALGYIGSSRTSVGILGANRYLPYDNGLQEDIARQIGGLREFTLGSAFTDGKTHYAEVWGQQFPGGNREVAMCWLEFTLLGEPAVEMWTGNYGEMELEVHHEDDLDPHIQIVVTDGDEHPLQDANVTLQNFERGVFERSVTDPEGKVTFDIELDWFCDINLTVTKHNFDQVRDFIRISDIIPPETSVFTTPVEPSGRNGWFLEDPSIRLVPNEKAVVHYRIGPSFMGVLNSSSNFTLPSLGEGVHDLHYFSEDDAGNFEEERHTRFMVDLNPPELMVTLSPEQPDGDNGWYGTEPLVTIEPVAEDPGSPVEIFYVMDGEERTYDGPFFVAEGIRSIPVFGIDKSGRASITTTIQLKVDTTPPEVTSELSIETPDGLDGWYVTSPLVELFTNEVDAVIEYRFSTREKFTTYSGPFHVEDGTHILQYRSVDRSGNIGTTESLPIKVDTREPTLTLNVLPEEPDGLEDHYVTTPTVRMNWYDNIDCTLHFRMDGSEWSQDVSRFEVPDGSHEVQAYAMDAAGNSCPVVSVEIKVDTLTPETEIHVKDPDSSGWYTNPPLIELRTDPDSEILYWWEGKGDVNTYLRPIDIPSGEGTFVLHYHSRDRAGNEEDENSRTFRIDSKNPILRLDTLRQGRNLFLIDCSGSSDGTDLSFRILEGNSVLVDWTADGNIVLELSDGDHTITVEARDEAGNVVSNELDLRVEPVWMPYLLYGGPGLLVVCVIAAVILLMARRRRRRSYHSYEGIEEHDSHLEAYEFRGG
ncbi:MAG: C25 family cysteine peptidase [Thermoplasmatota archaeon]